MGQGAYIFGCEGPKITPQEQAFFKETDPWGFILFARNVDTPDQLTRLCAELRDSVGRDAPILIDQEGGRVQRLRAPHWREWMPPLDQAKAGARAMWIRYIMIACELRAVGIDCNCAPMLDLAEAATHPFLKNRCYGGGADDVTKLGRAVSDGLLAGGVLPIIKHMPGHGRGTLDSHLEVPRVGADKATLAQTDFVPFKALNDLPMAMTSHVIYEDIDPHNPATTSPLMMQVIREEIGFHGLIMTDDLSMEALSGSVSERTKASITAGCDVVLHCNGKLSEMADVSDAAGGLSLAAQNRADHALNQRKTPLSVDIDALEAELEALMKRTGA